MGEQPTKFLKLLLANKHQLMAAKKKNTVYNFLKKGMSEL